MDIIMLLPDNIHPENSIYFNGAFVLNALKEKDAVDLLDLYQNTLKFHQMSFPTFVLCLDWLYLIDAAELKNGIVRLCS
uniref:ABC-three component system middle component 6 n=2 Tax=Roseivirga sp. TaxID=1964215 RepID=UPI00404825C9